MSEEFTKAMKYLNFAGYTSWRNGGKLYLRHYVNHYWLIFESNDGLVTFAENKGWGGTI